MKTDVNQHNESMHRGAPISSFKKAKELRENMTLAEIKLWEVLKGNNLGVKFRREHPVLIYIVDFYCHKKKLVIEVDGEYHNDEDQILKDKNRTKDLQENGLQVLRFTNEEVLNNMESVLSVIKRHII